MGHLANARVAEGVRLRLGQGQAGGASPQTGVRRMENYTYVNIFETKGLEYLLLVCFLVMFLLLVRYLWRRKG